MSQLSWCLADLATELGAEVRGNPEHVVTGVHTLRAAGSTDVSFLANPLYRPELASTRAGAVLMRPEDVEGFAGNALLLANPYLGYARLAKLFDRTPRPAAGIHPSAVVAEDAVIDPSVSIGPRVVVESGVTIGAGTVIEAGVVVGARCVIGRDCRLRANVTLYHECQLGDRVQIHSGAVIGADGFGFANDKGNWVKIAQIGRVVIHDDVDIGANTTVDRGALGDTILHSGVIIDNLVQVAHNVEIGENSAIAGCTGISGSTRIGRNCTLAGGVGLVGHIELCDRVHVTGMTMITKSITEPGAYSSGTAFDSTDRWKRMAVRLKQLDDMAGKLRKMEKEVAELRRQDPEEA